MEMGKIVISFYSASDRIRIWMETIRKVYWHDLVKRTKPRNVLGFVIDVVSSIGNLRSLIASCSCTRPFPASARRLRLS